MIVFAHIMSQVEILFMLAYVKSEKYVVLWRAMTFQG